MAYEIFDPQKGVPSIPPSRFISPLLMTESELIAHKATVRFCVECGADRGKFATAKGKCKKCYRETATERNKCFARNQGEKYPVEDSPFLEDYKRYLKNFTPHQKAQFREMMKTRCGKIAKAEAVDVIMREVEAGACCAKCAAYPNPDCGPDVHGLQSSWQQLIKYMEMLCGDSGD